jgi:hypothetical protein
MIFLSHSWTNKPIARQLVEALARESRPAWVDEQQLEAGAGLRAGLRDAIAKSDVYLYLVSKAANASPWVQDELQFAIGLEFEKKLKAIPVRLAGDDTPLPTLLAGRIFRSLDVAHGGGAARLANELREDASPVVPEGCRVSATVRLLPTGLSHTLDEARGVAHQAEVDALFLNEGYERLDALYWTLSEVKFPPAQGKPAELEYTASVVSEMHQQSRRVITELRELIRRYVGLRPDAPHAGYFGAGYLQAIRVFLHQLAWNCEYLTALRDSVPLPPGFVDRKYLVEPFEGHVCDFEDGTRDVGGVTVPPHGHPFADDTPPMPWGMSSPFADMLDGDVGKCLGHVIARRFLVGTLPSTEMLSPETLRYGLG